MILQKVGLKVNFKGVIEMERYFDGSIFALLNELSLDK